MEACSGNPDDMSQTTNGHGPNQAHSRLNREIYAACQNASQCRWRTAGIQHEFIIANWHESPSVVTG